MQGDSVADELEFDAQQVVQVALVLDFPPLLKFGDEVKVERVLVVVVVDYAQVVDVSAKVQSLLALTGGRVHLSFEGEDAAVGRDLREAVFLQPRVEGALPAAPGLRHAVFPYTGLMILHTIG